MYDSFKNFTKRLKLLVSKHPSLITTTLSNIFTMRLIGNKTHGDLAEIAISEFVHQYMYDYRSNMLERIYIKLNQKKKIYISLMK